MHKGDGPRSKGTVQPGGKQTQKALTLTLICKPPPPGLCEVELKAGARQGGGRVPSDPRAVCVRGGGAPACSAGGRRELGWEGSAWGRRLASFTWNPPGMQKLRSALQSQNVGFPGPWMSSAVGRRLWVGRGLWRWPEAMAWGQCFLRACGHART